MASFGERKSKLLGKGYESNPIKEYAQAFTNSVKACLNESVNYYKEPSTSLMNESVNRSLRKFFVEGSYDPTGMTPQQINEHVEDMNNLFDNDVEGFSESANVASFNAIVGLSLPMHKNIMMNMVFDKGAIPKEVALSEKFTRTMERRLLVKPDGTEIDMFLQQNELTAAMESVNPWKNIDLTLPQDGSTDIVTTQLNGAAVIDHVDIESYIGAVKISNVYFEVGDILPDETTGVVSRTGVKATAAATKDAWYEVKLPFTPGYGEIKRQLIRPVKLTLKKNTGTAEAPVVAAYTIDDIVSGSMIKDKFIINSMKGQIAAVRLVAKLDASNRTIDTNTVKWDEITDIVEIGTDVGINTTISPEEVKDISSLYNVNQLTKVMALMKTVLANRKDDRIKSGLDLSFQRLDDLSRFQGKFDYAPRDGYALDPVEWRRKTFFEYFDSQVTDMLQVLNDPNMSVSVFGKPDLIRRITPTEYTYQTPASIGPVDLDFTKTVVTSDRRVYQFIGSDKLRGNNELIITLCPRNTDRIIYVIYDYQMYISNEIRQNNNPALPNICAFERYKFDEYQPVQGRIQIVNPTGLRSTDGSETVAFR
jgi:hypothetical protein